MSRQEPLLQAVERFQIAEIIHFRTAAPPQVFAATDASEADAAQAASENLQLTSGRRDAWDRLQAQAAFELTDRIEKLQGRVTRHISVSL